MRTREAIDADIAATQSELQNVHGSTTEVYARIVGYYRSVRNWNKGKREEFSERKMFEHENPKISFYAGQSAVSGTETPSIQYPAFFEVYTRKTCPNCPPVKDYCNNLGIAIHYIDADTEEGIKAAAKHGVRSCPTVIMYNESEKELSRAYSVADLKAYHLTPYTAEAVIA
ncbi:hypothetical protein ABK01_06135 [Treponema sp. OMZ 305]|uniref:glutaredoxin family protein n=1 Tax=unclassified Treponema TaxID=2638727 RepID=UPI0020A4AAC5|nr:anaerobic ribonucleoside-triphosphate reductase [Treponema sp. OMZ 305]UTC57880.1 hypothetical protein ABK01_06135 [Treponema sp. OMZ 305]